MGLSGRCLLQMYQIGEMILYGSTGVCRVADIQVRKGANGEAERSYYTLEPLYQSCTISTPVDNEKIFMRPIITREEAERLIDLIPGMEGEAYHNRAMRELTEHYEAALRTYNCEDLVTLTMSIYAKKLDLESQKRKFGALDERFMRRAEDLLFGELAAALGIERDAVPDYIAARVAAWNEEKRTEDK